MIGKYVLIGSAFLGLASGAALADEDDKSRAATPKDIAKWASQIQQAYPAQALRNAEEGTVSMEIVVDEAGIVSECTVVKSSGSATLDLAGCDGMKAYARYNPALNANGKPIPVTLRQSIRYLLPDDPGRESTPNSMVFAAPVEIDTWYAKVFDDTLSRAISEVTTGEIAYVVTVDESGNPTGCGVMITTGKAEIEREVCARVLELAQFSPARLADGSTIPGSTMVFYPLPFNMNH